MLRPLDVDAQGYHAVVLAEVHPIGHQRHQIQLGQFRGQQLGQGGLGRGDEPARHRGLAGGGSGLLDTSTDRFQPDRVAPGREPRQHPLHHHATEHVGLAEQLVGRHRQFFTAVGRAVLGRATGCSPVPTARASRPSQTSPTSSASATLTCSGTAGWLVSSLSF